MIIPRVLSFPNILIIQITQNFLITPILPANILFYIGTIYLKLHFFVAQINILQHNKLRVACARRLSATFAK